MYRLQTSSIKHRISYSDNSAAAASSTIQRTFPFTSAAGTDPSRGASFNIFAVISALELWDECGGGSLPHYMRGRQPGKFPSFQLFRDNVHPVLHLYDPFGFNKNMSEETKERRLVAELNNGRLAQLGIFGFLCADKIPGSVPALDKIAIPYEGDPMIPFEGQFSYLSGNPFGM